MLPLAEEAERGLMGTTCMKLDDCVAIYRSMQKQMQSSAEVETENGHRELVNYQPPWPFTLACPVSYDKSCDFTKLSMPSMHGETGDNSVVWILLAIAVSSNVIWMNLADCVSTDVQWMGWFLAYAARNTLNVYKWKGGKQSQKSHSRHVKKSWN